MLRYSFCGLGGLSLDAERRLWQHGIVSWDDYRRCGQGIFGSARHARVLTDIAIAETAMDQNDVRYFLHRLPVAEQVRLWPHVRTRLIYLDIETTGLGRDDLITTAVMYNGRDLSHFVRGHDLMQLPDAIPTDAVLVTYNGRRFDLPRLRQEFGRSMSCPHLDLCPILRARGYTGGLKVCEQRLRVKRRSAANLHGADAVRLWHAYGTGDEDALRRLLVYNQEDALALERLLIAAYNESMNSCPTFSPVPFPRQPTSAEE